MKHLSFLCVLLFIISNGIFAQVKDGDENAYSKIIRPQPETQIDCSPIPMNGCNFIRNNNFSPSITYNPNDVGMRNDPFGLGYITNWVPSHGTAQIIDPFFPPWFATHPSPPSPALEFCYMGYRDVAIPFTSPPVWVPGGEGIAQKISPLTAGNKYALSFFKSQSLPAQFNTVTPNKFMIILMKCSDYNTFNTISYQIPSYPLNSQIIYCETDVVNWMSWEQSL